jgi:hypothetical protein
MRNTAMNNSQYFIAKDYLRAFDLKNIFHKYVVIYSQLHCRDGDDPLSNKDRNELDLKLLEAMNEMTLLVLKMKESKQEKAEQGNGLFSTVHSARPGTIIAQQIN